MSTIQNVATAIQEQLAIVKAKVGEIKDSDGNAIQVPNYDDLYAAASNLDAIENPIEVMYVINSLLGRASNIGSETISFNGGSTEYQLEFPKDHSLHGKMGDEWYWLGCHLNVTDENGNKGKLSIMDTMQKIRAVGMATQAKYNWTDEQTSLCCNIATVTVKMDADDETTYYRRSANKQWALKGGNVSFNKANEAFSFEVGPDSLKGTEGVLPLQLLVNDGDTMQIDITFSHSYFLNTETSFFKQGIPTKENVGTGFTPLPTPGIYYSWPQLEVTGTIKVGGHTYTVDSGIGWIDHQLMMTSILNSNGQPDTTLFQKTLTNHPYNGWIWQYFNLENQTSFTGAGFVQGEIPANNIVKMVYGYYLQPNVANKSWDSTFVMGDIELEDYQNFPSICDKPKSTPVSIPVERTYKGVANLEDLSLLFHPIEGQALPWFSDGTFNNPNNSFCAEFPADFISGNPDHHPNGVGYLESVGWEKVSQYNAYALSVIKSAMPKTIVSE